MKIKKENRGGVREGAGRKPLPKDKKRKVASISMNPIHFTLTKFKRSFLIEKALQKYFE